MTDSNRHVVCCSDVIDEPVVCQEDTRELVVQDSFLVDASYTKEVKYLWWPVASTSLFRYSALDEVFHHKVRGSLVTHRGDPGRRYTGSGGKYRELV